MTRLIVVKIEIALFFTLWCLYGALINSRNLEAFGLQQAGVEAYVERQHFYLEGSLIPQLHVRPVIDAFMHNDHIYPAKQPGQFMLGACAYAPLRAVGLTYARNYLLTAALVTFLTASLVAAASSVALFRAARLFTPTRGIFWPLIATLSYALGSTVLAYSGIAWHDTLGTGYLAIGCYCILRLPTARRPALVGVGAGCFLGLTISTSMLPFTMAIVAAAFSVIQRPRVLPAILGGLLVGLSPMFIYNAICFGNPLLLSNVIGNYRDTFFHPSFENFVDKGSFYLRMVTLYVPVFWFGLAGLAAFPRRLGREQLFLMTMLGALGLYILNIDANGTCQYGPRYLLPAMPIACLGLIGFSFIKRPHLKHFVSFTVAGAAVVSFAINIVGAMHGAMLCDFPHAAFGRYISEMLHGDGTSFPLLYWLLVPGVLSAALLVSAAWRNDQVHESAQDDSALER